MSKVYLFCGVETFSWQESDFQKVIDFAVAHKIDGLIVKIFEITQGPWYVEQGGAQKVLDWITSAGLDVLPYGYFYGVSPEELHFALASLETFGKFCMNCEGTWDNNTTFASTALSVLKNHPGELWISTWANPVDHHWTENISILNPIVQVWMPEEYGDANVARRLSQFPIVAGHIFPTYEINSNTISLTSITDNPSLWEWQLAEANPQWIDDYVTHLKGTAPVVTQVKLNSQGCVCDVIRSNQLFENEMELCGPWAAKAVAGAGKPGQGSQVSVEDIDQWVDAYVTKEGFTPQNFPGVSIPDMENILKTLGVHWQEIKSDVATIRKVVQAGYAVLFTANEQNIFRWGGSGWVAPYPWSISANHVLPVTGIDANGNFRCPDQLSQVPDANWPPIYYASRLSPSYAVIVQIAGTQTIPSGDPSSWPANFNAQGGTPVTTQTNTNQQTAWLTEVTALADHLSLTLHTDSGIMKFVFQEYQNGKYLGPALTEEINSVTWAGQDMTMQLFAGGRVQWINGNATLYTWA